MPPELLPRPSLKVRNWSLRLSWSLASAYGLLPIRPQSALRTHVRLCRRPLRAHASLPGLFETKPLYRDSLDFLLFSRSDALDVGGSNSLFRQIHPLRDRRSWRPHRAGQILPGWPPSALPAPTPPELCLTLHGLCKAQPVSASRFEERYGRQSRSTGFVRDRAD